MNNFLIMVKNSKSNEIFDFEEFLKSHNYTFTYLGKKLNYSQLLNICSEIDSSNSDLFISDKFENWIILDIPKFELIQESIFEKIVKENEIVVFFKYGDATGACDEEIYENGNLIHEVSSMIDYEKYDSLSMEEKDELIELPLRKPKVYNLEKAKSLCKDFRYDPDLIYEKLYSQSNPILLKVNKK